jgi:hypothetical protein
MLLAVKKFKACLISDPLLLDLSCSIVEMFRPNWSCTRFSCLYPKTGFRSTCKENCLFWVSVQYPAINPNAIVYFSLTRG